MFDLIVVGGGPAGITASIYARRAGLQVLVLSGGQSSLLRAGSIENYYGFETPVSGAELFRRGQAQARALGVEVAAAEVVGVMYDGAQFQLTTSDGSVFEARALVLATGAGRVIPKLAGVQQLEGRGVSYCALCDGFFYRGKAVAVLGAGDYALHEAAALVPIAAGVTLLTDGAPAPAAVPPNIAVRTEKLEALLGEEKLTGVRFAGGETLPLDGLFVALGVAGSAELARVMGAQLEGTRIAVDARMKTSIEGLFACGDCTGGLLQISKAVHEGTIAGTEAVKFLRAAKKD